MTFLNVNGAVIHHRIRRRGDFAVVLLNSLGTDLRIWDDVVSELPDDWTILQMDNRGHGLSQEADACMDVYASDVAGLMDHYGIGPALVCGVSIGGMIAQRLFHMRPDLVRSLLLSNTAAKIGDAESWQARLDLLNKVGLDAMADGVLERWFSEGFRSGRPDDTQGYRAMLARTPAEGYAAACRAIRDTDLRDKSNRIDVPVICISGSDDQATPPELVADFANTLPRATLTEISGAGHLPCIETPSEVAAALIDLAERT
ncbi:3-oxoadipate enol-lactonase [Roseibacterium beibuensis]|uniref:3-oxoadipate enol-lactonase n=1 Tax=[Roseibacterium] beibuensis TaxID=1193142 RepID=A0ABP9LIZ6_9RHOB|nr:3-oxoadipate enol-lactonase [Roseibacterium beibuensis]MCS6623516.1 3-oxoadipate enol-lactonase [Roseibacterium beibuensis]